MKTGASKAPYLLKDHASQLGVGFAKEPNSLVQIWWRRPVFTYGSDPRHIHVYKNRRMVLKWNLDQRVVMRGTLTKKLKRLIDDLVKEDKF